MTLRRVVALAQALTMILLLAPGPLNVGPTPVHAAPQPAEPGSSYIFDATGKGIGCQAGIRPYKGPRLPKDPPWPPGAEPTPSPTPTPEPTTESSDDLLASPDVDASASPDPDDPSAGAPMALVAATSIRVAQADLEAGPNPTAAPARGKLLPGIDVSHHQKDIDFGQVAGSGHRFVLMKATENNDHLDTYFSTNVVQARAAGLIVGAYHAFDYTLDGKAQADHYVDRVEAVAGFEGLLPPLVDVECWDYYGASIHAVATTRLRDFVERVYERTGRMPIIYTSVYMWRQVVGNAEGFEQNPLWAACWGCDEPISIPPGWDDWVFWQTTISKDVPGIRGRVDGNYFDGTRKDLNALKLRPFSIESGSLATSSEKVMLDLGGRDATHIRTSPDGESWSEWSRIRSAPSAVIPTDEGEHAVFAQFRNGPGRKSPVVSDSIIVDHTPPQMSAPTVSLREGVLGTDAVSIPVSVRWEATDAVAGLSDATVSVSCAEGSTQRTDAPGSAAPGELAAWEAETALSRDATCAVTAISRDGAGNGERATERGFTTSYVTGDRADVAGDQVGVVAGRGPDAGRAAVLLDGEALGLVDLYAPEVRGPEIVFTADLPSGTHRVELEATGSADPASTGTAISIDGFVTLARQP